MAEILFIYSVSNVILLQDGITNCKFKLSNLVILVGQQADVNCLFKSDHWTTPDTEQGSEIPEWPIG